LSHLSVTSSQGGITDMRLNRLGTVVAGVATVAAAALFVVLTPTANAAADHALPLDPGAVPREAYAAAHWNANPAVDLIVTNVPAYAVTAGQIDHYDSASCGIGIRLLQPDGSRFIYCHLSERAVAEGAAVPAGTHIGTTGDTGNSGAPHLHIEVRTADGTARCPQSYLLAIHDGASPPSLDSLPTSGCTVG
jgi:murein DD-endopeptidase MepM/ murein hydrolase activator NlpD